MEHAVDPAPAPLELAAELGPVVGVGDVELEHVGRGRQPLGRPLGQRLGPAERGEHHLGALLLGHPGAGERDGRRREHAGDEQLLVLEQHGFSWIGERSEGGVGVAPGRQLGPLGGQPAEGGDQVGAGVARVDDRVDVAALGGDAGRAVLLLVLAARAGSRSASGSSADGDVALVEDGDRARARPSPRSRPGARRARGRCPSSSSP